MGVCGVVVFKLDGCAVSSPDVKQASTQMTVALKSLDEAEVTFKRAYLEEIEKTRQQVERAIIAQAIQKKITVLAEDEKRGDLITISRQIEDTEAAMRALVTSVSQSNVKAGDDAQAKLTEYIKKQAAQMRRTAEQIKEYPERAANLKRQADLLEAGQSYMDASLNDDLLVLLKLGAMRAEVEKGLGGLEAHIKVLRDVHSVVDGWIMTDVKVSGKEVAGVVTKHAATLGLAADTTKGGQ